jgi:hypothetical protein
MSHWQLFTNSFGKMLHPVLWLYGLVVALGSSSLGVLLLFNTQLLRNLVTQTPQALRATLASLAGIIIVVGVIGFVFATFGEAALIHLVNRLELRERATVGAGLDGGERIFQLLAVRVILILPNLLVVALSIALIQSQISRGDLVSGANLLAGLSAGFCGILVIGLLVSLLTSALSVGAERAIVIEKMSIGKALGLSWQLFAAQLGDFLIIGLIFLGLSVLLGVLFSCVGQPLIGLLLRTASPAALTGGSLLTNPIAVLSVGIGLIENVLATILVTSVWTLAYRQWRADRLPAPPRHDFDDQTA